MDLNDYQKAAGTTAVYPATFVNNTPVPFVTPALGLVGEAGETANLVKKVLRNHDGVVTPEFAARLKDELGDTLWYLAETARVLGFTLNEVAEQNLAKLEARRAAGTIASGR